MYRKGIAGDTMVCTRHQYLVVQNRTGIFCLVAEVISFISARKILYVLKDDGIYFFVLCFTCYLQATCL